MMITTYRKHIKNKGMTSINKIGIYLFSLLGVLFSSCNKVFLDEELTIQYSTDYWDTSEGIEELTRSVYGDLRWHFGYEWAYGTTHYGTDEFTNANDLPNEMWNTYATRLGSLVA